MSQSWLWVMRAWGHGCMVVHRPRIGSEGRADCGWGQVWLCMGSGLGCGGTAGCTWGQGQYVRPCKHAWTLEPFMF